MVQEISTNIGPKEFVDKINEIVDALWYNTGTIISASYDIPGFLLCDGSAVSVSMYPELYRVLGTTYGGSGDTFYLPNFIGRYQEGRTSFAYTASSLPAHVHNSYVYDRNVYWGGIDNTLSHSCHGAGAVSTYASETNSLYGAASFVRPYTMTVRMYIKY